MQRCGPVLLPVVPQSAATVTTLHAFQIEQSRSPIFIDLSATGSSQAYSFSTWRCAAL